RLRHERRRHAVLQRDATYDRTERSEAVGRREGVGGGEVDLVLAGRDLVMHGLGIEVHVLQHPGNGSANQLAVLQWLQVEVAPTVRGARGEGAVSRRVEHEELNFGSHPHYEPGLGRELD